MSEFYAHSVCRTIVMATTKKASHKKSGQNRVLLYVYVAGLIILYMALVLYSRLLGIPQLYTNPAKKTTSSL